ncbi:unnamed protein product [Linum tenue]|uniref:Uncharacterized protein n=1 Tax=Linum tenue TaxID=586396 RepID=A0AAV0K1Y8_9ROSI|nr:unnamed protein product [Linum tenue]
MHAKRWQIQGGNNLQNCIYRRHAEDLSCKSPSRGRRLRTDLKTEGYQTLIQIRNH